MAKKEYKFNPHTLTYEVMALPFRVRFYRLLRKILIGFILASLVNFFFSYFFYTPKMYLIGERNRELMIQYDILREKIDASNSKLLAIRHRDQHVYRSLFGADTLDMPGVWGEYPESKYASFAADRYAPLMLDTWHRVDRMARLLYMESVSMDELQRLSADKERMTFSVPAIWPVDRTRMTGQIGRFSSSRLHPILGYRRPHRGIDLPARRGEPVYATGNGKVVLESSGGSGYGRQVLIDHGFGYKTRYAHLNRILVEPGQEVRRGEMIGEVGNTGLSKGPHLHYEVIYMNQHVDPINYFRRDMSESDFQAVIESARETIYE